MSVKSEPLSWEVLDYWKASGLSFSASVPGSTFVSRDKAGKVNGFVALSNRQDTALRLILEPLIADNGPIVVRLVDKLEAWMIKLGLPGYVFFADPADLKWAKQLTRMVELGIFVRLGEQKSGPVWYGRRFKGHEHVE